MSGNRVMPGFHEDNGGRLGEDTKTERFLSNHVAFSVVIVLWCFAFYEATISRRIQQELIAMYELFAMQPHEAQKHTALTLGMHLIFVPVSLLGLALVPFWALEIGAAPVVARAVVWIDASILLLWEVRELFLLSIFNNKALIMHHLSTCVIIIAILDFEILRDITWLQLLFLACNTVWLQRPVTIFSRFVDDRIILSRLKLLGCLGIGLDIVQLVCALWFFIACSVMGDYGAAIIVIGVAIPITYLRVQVNCWVWRFDPDFAIRRQKQKLHHHNQDKIEAGNNQESNLDGDAIVHFHEAEAAREAWLSKLTSFHNEDEICYNGDPTSSSSLSTDKAYNNSDTKEDQ